MTMWLTYIIIAVLLVVAELIYFKVADHFKDLPGDRFLACGYLACILKRTSGKSVTDLSVLEQLR